MIDLTVDIGRLRLKNPVLTASGTCGYGREYAHILDLNQLGGIMVKGTSLVPWAGNPAPRVVETPAGMLNAIGLQNPGLDYFLHTELPWLRQFDTAVVVNIAAHQIEEYAELARRLDNAAGVAALEVNISCPNVRQGGLSFGSDPLTAHRVTAAVRQATSLPVIVKLTPNVTDIAALARAVAEAGADAVSLINTLLGMVIDVRARRPALGNIVGGLSGPAIRPVAVRMVWEVAGAVSIPVIGMGGITCAEDALQFLMAGASAVAIGTATFANPRAPFEVMKGMAAFLQEEGFTAVSDIIGLARRGIA
ncbi:MAG TPA: dihydroorotate dehydrogenase [Firmicutes bacterium]|jgi:dihydroorotate dehydrogenase (NAD+) catalytic subunit|nr:dihydroorotate dehydrogenase [Bacillota bacterium]